MSIFICFVLAAIVNIIQSVIEYKESRERLLNPREARERANRGRYTLSRLRAIPDPILDAVVEVGH